MSPAAIPIGRETRLRMHARSITSAEEVEKVAANVVATMRL